MEVGYSTLDLAMLVIAAFVIWLSTRIPKVEPATEQKKIKFLGRTKEHRAGAVTSLKA